MTIAKIESCTISAGDSLPVEIKIRTKDDPEIDLSEYECYFILSEYGFEDSNILVKRMNKKSSVPNVFVTTLLSAETINLEPGTYTSKVVLKHGDELLKKARGIFDVKKDTNSL